MPTQINNVDSIDYRSLEYCRMRDNYWRLIEDLKGGTRTMRAASERWLPKHPAEKAKFYNVRRDQSFLFNAYDEAVTDHVDRPFTRTVSLQGVVPSRLQVLEQDVDNDGKSLTTFAREVLEAAIDYGVVHCLVDYPQTRGTETRAEEEALRIRPTFVLVKAPELIGWQSELDASGGRRLTQIRIHETKIEPKGRYGDQEVEYVRLYTERDFELWRREDGEDDFVLDLAGSHTLGQVPLVTLYLNREGFLTAKPVFEDLAWMNVAHWQSYSDQRYILNVARLAILFGRGFPEELLNSETVIGANRTIFVANEQADLKYVEHSGAAMESGQKDLEWIQRRMEVLGSRPEINRAGATTATERLVDEAGVTHGVQTWIRALETFLRRCYEVAGMWVGVELPEDFAADVYNEFGLGQRSNWETEFLRKLRLQGDLTRETLLDEIKRRGLLSDAFEVDAEVTAIEEARPEIGMFGQDSDDNDEGETDEEPDSNQSGGGFPPAA